MSDMNGGCLCGAVRYRLTACPDLVDCHCRNCRRASGAAFTTWACVPFGALHWTAGAPASFASSAGCRRLFCATCGSTLAMEYLPAEEQAVALGSLDAPGRLRARTQIWTDERIAAADGAAPGAPCHRGNMPAGVTPPVLRSARRDGADRAGDRTGPEGRRGTNMTAKG